VFWEARQPQLARVYLEKNLMGLVGMVLSFEEARRSQYNFEGEVRRKHLVLQTSAQYNSNQ
jgi:hypothetical protein